MSATARAISADDELAARLGRDSIPPDEAVGEPDPADYAAPAFLAATAPDLAAGFQPLLDDLCELNARFVGHRTLDAQAYLGLTGDHEGLEAAFLDWSRAYFGRRGGPDRLTPQVGGDPWRLCAKCLKESHQLPEQRLVRANTVNPSVLNLSQSYMLSEFAFRVTGRDVASVRSKPDRFTNDRHRTLARERVAGYAAAWENR